MALSGNKLLNMLEDSGYTVVKVDTKKSANNPTSTANKGNTTSASSLKGGNSFTSNLLDAMADVGAPIYTQDDIAPVRTTTTTKKKKKDEEEDDRKWFQKGAFDDGRQFGDVFKTILGTDNDILKNIGHGARKMAENAIDFGADMIGQAADKLGADNLASKMKDFVKKDISTESPEAFAPLSRLILNNPNLQPFTAVVKGISTLSNLVNGEEDNSVLGDRADSFVQSATRYLIQAGLGRAGVPWQVTAGVTSYGAEAENAYNNDASHNEAALSALVSAGGEFLSEYLTGGAFGAPGLDDLATKSFARDISNKTLRSVLKYITKALGEPLEEVFSWAVERVGQKLTYANNKTWKELYPSDEAKEELVDAIVSSLLLSGTVQGADVVKAKQQGVDYTSGLTANEEKVVDKAYRELVAKAEKNGKVTNKQKNAIYDEVLRDMERGYISTDTIEEVLGGETYQNWKNTVDSEDALRQEYEELGKKQNATLAEQTRYNELHQQMNELKTNSQRNALKDQLGSEVMTMVKGDRLIESYNERSRRGQAYQADLSKYDEKQRATIQKAIDSGILNNTNRTHEFVDLVAKITADKGIVFDFTNNERLKNSSFSLDGKAVNGYVTKDGVVLNIDSKKSLNSVVGREITHVLEGTELYQTLQDVVTEYAKSKGDYQGRYDALTKLYEGVEGADVNAELTADLVGDYLFTDTDFVRNLSVQHRNVFQKIYDEIKYLCKVATAGSEEARELERVKKKFEDAYRAAKNTTAESGVKYSLSGRTNPTYEELAAKNPIHIVDVKTGIESGSYADMKAAALKTATEEGWFDRPHHNADTDSFIFLTEKSYTHAYSNLTSSFGEDTIRCMAHIPEIIENAVLVRVDDPKNPFKQETKVYTFFGAVDGVNGTEPVKLTVKEFDFKSLDSVPQNIRSYFEKNGAAEQYNSLYDAHALEVVGIEGIKKEPDASGKVNEQSSQAQATSDSTISIEELLNLVKGDAEKYVPKRNYSLSSNEGNINSEYAVSDSDGKQLSKEQQEYFKDSKVRDDAFAPIADDPARFDSLDDADGQQTFAKEEPKQMTEEERTQTRKRLHQGIMDNIKATFKAKGLNFDNVLKNAKNLSTLSTVDNTPQRVMEKALGYKEGRILGDLTVNKVAQNESEGIKWLNRKIDTIKKISRQYGIKPGSKQSAAAQMYAEGFYVAENNDIIKYGDAELAKDFPNIKVQQSIKQLANDPRIRRIYDETLAAINESRTRNAYPEIPRLDNYYLHFRAMEDTFSRLGLPFNPNDIRAKDLPTDLNGVTADLKPGQPYFASANHRRGKRTSFDLLGGLERYLNSAKNQIYHIDDIQTLRALRNYIAETYGQAVGLENLDTLTNEEAQERIEQIYGSHLSTFAKFLNEEANVIAGKTALIDRGLEGIIGRRGMTFMNSLNGQVGSNMVGFNISSSLTNFLPVAQTFAKTNKFDFTKAFAQTVANKLSGGRLDSFAEDSPVMIRRKGADRFYRTPWQKAGDVGYVFMSAVDDISTEMIARTKYNELTRKGMDPQTAHFETDKWVSRLMGDRSLGQMPQLYNSKMLGLFTKFQLEVRNQLDSQFYDTIKEAEASSEHIQNGLLRNAKMAAKVTSTLVQLAAVQHLYGTAFEQIAGYNPAFDIIEVLITAFGYDDEEDSEDTAVDNLTQAILALAEDLPYTSVVLDGGRIPVSSAIPDFASVLKGEDEYGNEIGVIPALKEEIKEVAPYYLMPGGYGQFKKTKAGLEMYSDEHPIAGSYTDSGNLRFPVEDAPIDKAKAAIFGQYASENARKYFAGEERTLNPDQTKIFAELDMPIEDYWEYRDNLYEFYDYKDALSEAAKADSATEEDILKSKFISSVYSDINALYKEQKEAANGNSLLKSSRIKEIQKKMSGLLASSQRASNQISVTGKYAEVGGRRFNYSPEKDTWYELKPKNDDGTDNWYYQKEQEVTKGLGIGYEEYWNNREEYNYAYDHPQSYAIAKSVGGYDEYVSSYYPYLVDKDSGVYIFADKDANGDSIAYSRQKKVKAWLQELDIPEMDKLLLYKSVYNSYDDRNYEIIDYLNGRDDLTFEDRVNALRGLGFNVTDDGNISWK